MKRILVPLDGSALADRAIPFAAALAARASGTLLLLRAVNTYTAPTEAAGLALQHEAQAALEAKAATLRADGLTVSTRVVDRQAESAILEASADLDVDLIVMSTHGRGGLGRFVYGSVADTVLRHAPVPVLTVPPHGLERWPSDGRVEILVPLDGSDLSQAALDSACELADVLGGSLLLASVVTFPSYAAYADGYVFADPEVTESVVTDMRHYLESVADRLRTPTRPVSVCATYGTPFFGITNVARDRGVGAIVMATHGRSGMTRALLGSVATATLRQTDVPVVLVRPEAFAPAAEPAVPVAQPAVETPTAPAPEPVATEPVATTVTVSLLLDELALLTRVVGERFHGEPVDPARAEPTRRLLEKLRTARASAPPSAATNGKSPALSGRT